jgi:hypothetical protein
LVDGEVLEQFLGLPWPLKRHVAAGLLAGGGGKPVAELLIEAAKRCVVQRQQWAASSCRAGTVPAHSAAPTISVACSDLAAVGAAGGAVTWAAAPPGALIDAATLLLLQLAQRCLYGV